MDHDSDLPQREAAAIFAAAVEADDEAHHAGNVIYIHACEEKARFLAACALHKIDEIVTTVNTAVANKPLPALAPSANANPPSRSDSPLARLPA